MSETEEYVVPEAVTTAWKALRFKRKYRWIVLTVDEETKLYQVESAETDL